MALTGLRKNVAHQQPVCLLLCSVRGWPELFIKLRYMFICLYLSCCSNRSSEWGYNTFSKGVNIMTLLPSVITRDIFHQSQ